MVSKIICYIYVTISAADLLLYYNAIKTIITSTIRSHARGNYYYTVHWHPNHYDYSQLWIEETKIINEIGLSDIFLKS